MTSHSGTVEDERLREMIAFAEKGEASGAFVHSIRTEDTLSICRELLALRSAPSRPVEAGELVPVAWRYRDAWGRWAYCKAIDNINGPTVITEKQALVPASSLTSLQARVGELERERAQMQEDADQTRANLLRDVELMRNRAEAAEVKYRDECAIVTRIWAQLGNPTYEELAGRSIYDLVDELKAKATRLQEAEKALAPLEYIANWYDGMGAHDSESVVDLASADGSIFTLSLWHCREARRVRSTLKGEA